MAMFDNAVALVVGVGIVVKYIGGSLKTFFCNVFWNMTVMAILNLMLPC